MSSLLYLCDITIIASLLLSFHNSLFVWCYCRPLSLTFCLAIQLVLSKCFPVRSASLQYCILKKRVVDWPEFQGHHVSGFNLITWAVATPQWDFTLYARAISAPYAFTLYLFHLPSTLYPYPLPPLPLTLYHTLTPYPLPSTLHSFCLPLSHFEMG